MIFSHFSGVFGLFERTKLIENGTAGFADKNFGIKNNTDFSYATASGTKGFTAVAILTLVAEGRLRLDNCVKSILQDSGKTATNGEFRGDVGCAECDTSCAGTACTGTATNGEFRSDVVDKTGSGTATSDKIRGATQKYGALDWLSDSVTVSSLLNHTSGVPDYFDEEIFDDFEGCLHGNANYHYEKPEDFFPLTESVWKSQKTPYKSAGTFKYSNGGFVILAAVVEAVTGTPFPSYMTEHVFAKLGMNKSGFFRLDETPPDGIVRATGYQENGRSNVYGVPVIGGGDGGAFTTVSDMASFWNKLDPELNPESKLSPLIEEAWEARLDGDDGLYGLGFWMRRENPRIVFLEGFDPGVQFFSFYNRDTKRSLTICLNDEQMNCGEVFNNYFKEIL